MIFLKKSQKSTAMQHRQLQQGFPGGRNKKRARQFEITICKGPIEFIRAVTCILAKYNPRTEELP